MADGDRVAIRKRYQDEIFCKGPSEFSSPREYDDYLEEMEEALSYKLNPKQRQDFDNEGDWALYVTQKRRMEKRVEEEIEGNKEMLSVYRANRQRERDRMKAEAAAVEEGAMNIDDDGYSDFFDSNLSPEKKRALERKRQQAGGYIETDAVKKCEQEFSTSLLAFRE